MTPLPASERERLLALARQQIMDTVPEAGFDRITALASQVLNVPFAAINFMDATRQWSKAAHGFVPGSLERGFAPCTQVVADGKPLVIQDMRQDTLYAHTMGADVPAGPGLRSYAGVPLKTDDGLTLGTLCVLDRDIRDFGEQELSVMATLAEVVMDELALRSRTRDLIQARDHAATLRDLAELMQQPLSPQQTAEQTLLILKGWVAFDWLALLRLNGTATELVTEYTRPAGDLRRPQLHERLHTFRPSDAQPWSGPSIVFREDGEGAAHPWPTLDDLGARQVAWLHLSHPSSQEAFVLVLIRFEEQDAWTSDERALMEAAARSISVALERIGHMQTLERAALQDALTGLGNRRALDTALDELAQTGEPYVVAIIDLDGMKRINDERGHASGDMLLREFARQLHAPGVTAYRLGGDEYALLAPAAGDARATARSLKQLSQDAALAVQRAGYPASASIGVARVPEEARDATAALRTADQRMYLNKRERRASRDLSTPVR